MSEPIIEVRHLSKRFGRNEVLRDLDFSVLPGEVISIIGASGSGKSTLLRCINLLEEPTGGSILFHGQEVTAPGTDPCALRARVGMVFQSFNLFNNMTVLENCVAGQRKVLRRGREEARANAMAHLEKVGMASYINAKPRQLSGGQKQRVAIARALSTNPEVLLCDEPTSALDSLTTKSVLKLLYDITPKLHVTIVIITHEIAVVKAICNKVAVIDAAEFVECGSTKEVFADPKSDITKLLLGREETKHG